ncbi:uncharacterized protein TNCV_2984031 [Trichonephila clavipes]|nr:uncharacterized protein TNCV_2984031 [Trichonephila clavipes]
MSEEALVIHIFVRLKPQVKDYVEVRNSKITAQLLEVMAKFEERYSCKEMRGSKSSDNVGRRGWGERRMSNDDDRRGNWKNTEVLHRPNNGRNNYRGNYENGPQWSQRNGGSRTEIQLIGMIEVLIIMIEDISPEIEARVKILVQGTKVIAAKGAKCRNVRIVELQIRITEFVKPCLFHVLADLEYPCFLGVDFISVAKIVLDFGQKLLEIPDSQFENMIPTVEEGNLEIGLTKTGLDESQKQELQDLFNSFKGLFSYKLGLARFIS